MIAGRRLDALFMFINTPLALPHNVGTKSFLKNATPYLTMNEATALHSVTQFHSAGS